MRLVGGVVERMDPAVGPCVGDAEQSDRTVSAILWVDGVLVWG